MATNFTGALVIPGTANPSGQYYDNPPSSANSGTGPTLDGSASDTLTYAIPNGHFRIQVAMICAGGATGTIGISFDGGQNYLTWQTLTANLTYCAPQYPLYTPLTHIKFTSGTAGTAKCYIRCERTAQGA